MKMMKTTVMFAAALILASCGKSDDDDKPAPAAKANISDYKLPSDPGAAIVEMERRLAESVKSRDGIIVVRSKPTEKWLSYFLSPNTPWIITCGIGITVVFGAGVSGESVANEVEISLSYEPTKQDVCDIAGPRLAKRLTQILRESAGEEQRQGDPANNFR